MAQEERKGWGIWLDCGYRRDLVVRGSILLELKVVDPKSSRSSVLPVQSE